MLEAGAAAAVPEDAAARMSSRLAIADRFAQLVAHVLAHVPLAEQPGNLHDARYVAWARERMPANACALLEHDAALIGERWRSDRRLDVLHGVFELQGDLDEFRRTAARTLAELEMHEVRSPTLLALLRDPAIAPIAELLHTTLALLVDDYALTLAGLAPQLESARESVEPILDRLAAIVPGFEHARVELVWALGVHGRAFPDRILVGAPAAWSGCSAARQAVLAAHEHCVRASVADDYLGSEWDALVGLARIVGGSNDPELRDAHARWLAELDLDELLRGVVARGWLSHDSARSLLDDRLGRASSLALHEAAL
jgi:hypothetical protein